jgi:hypothetical protein
MQLVGMHFTNETALAGNDLSTLPDFPAEIRAPAGTLAGVSGFQLHFSSRDVFTPGDAPEPLSLLSTLSDRYVRSLFHHIDAENSVLFPESAARFRRTCVAELPNRAPDADEEAARADGERLVATYAPSRLPDVLRGQGCVSCDAFGDRCQGIELEWWSELEWEDAFERIG